MNQLSNVARYLAVRTILPISARCIGSVPQQSFQEQNLKNYVKVNSTNGKDTKLSLRWLRDNCSCPSCKDPVSGLRLNASIFEPKLKSSQFEDGFLNVTWQDDHKTSLKLDSLLDDTQRDIIWEKKTLWNKEIAKTIPFATVDFQKLLTTEATVAEMLDSVLKYGIVIVDGVPPTSEHTKQVVERVGPVARTFWGGVYDVVADLGLFEHPSYTGNTLKLHTDSCYYHHSPGLQAFHVTEHNGDGGINCFVDGFYIANKIKQEKPDVYEYLSKTPIPYRYFEERKQLHIIMEDYIIMHHPVTKNLVQVRYTPYDNDIYRTRPQNEMKQFYHSIETWKSELTNEEHIHWLQLKPGSVLLTDNWRIFHGRSSFNGKRVLCGMYLTRSDFLSKARTLGLI
ncbi:hypothetical protein CHUAL_005468 [Chamberlinius hualienensis]